MQELGIYLLFSKKFSVYVSMSLRDVVGDFYFLLATGYMYVFFPQY